jgi:hypothetical protein
VDVVVHVVAVDRLPQRLLDLGSGSDVEGDRSGPGEQSVEMPIEKCELPLM